MILSYIISLIVLTLCQQVVEAQLVGGACSIVDTNMYFAGGAIGSSVAPQNNIFTLDLKAGFKVTDSANLKPSALPEDSRLPVYGAVFNPTRNGTLLYVYGSSQSNFTLANTGTPITGQGVDKFDLNTKAWARSNQPSAPTLRESFAWMTTPTSLYIFGGRISNTNKLTNELWRYDVASDDWTQLSTSSDVPAMRFTTGVRIDNTLIILPGAGEDDVVKDLKTVYLYDIPSNTWRLQATTRSDRRQVIQYKPVVYKNKVLIQGGVNSLNPASSNFIAWDDLIALDTTNWEFSTYKLKSDFGSTIRIGYGAWAIGDQLVQFFGQPSPVQTTSSGATFNPMQVIDLNTFQAVPIYSPPPESFFSSNTSAQPESKALSTGAIIGIVFGVLGLILLIVGIIYFFRRKISKLKEELSPPDYFGNRNSKHVSQSIANENGVVWAEGETNRNKPGNNRNTANESQLSSNGTLTELGTYQNNGGLNSSNNRSYHQDQDQRIFNLNETQLAPDELDNRFES